MKFRRFSNSRRCKKMPGGAGLTGGAHCIKAWGYARSLHIRRVLCKSFKFLGYFIHDIFRVWFGLSHVHLDNLYGTRLEYLSHTRLVFLSDMHLDYLSHAHLDCFSQLNSYLLTDTRLDNLSVMHLDILSVLHLDVLIHACLDYLSRSHSSLVTKCLHSLQSHYIINGGADYWIKVPDIRQFIRVFA